LAIIYIPIFGILLGSFINLAPEDNSYIFSFDGYLKAIANTELLVALENSLFIALISSLITTLIGAALSFALQSRSQKILLKVRKIFYLPMLLPEIVIGISLLIWFVVIHFSLGQLSLIISHVTFTLPYAVILVTIGLEGIDKTLVEAARDLGANQKQIFIRLTLPMLKPTLLGVFVLSFVISFDDFLISYFTAGAGNDTLPMKLYALMRFGLSGELKAISSIILFSSIIVTALLLKFLRTSLNNESTKADSTSLRPQPTAVSNQSSAIRS
jgi:spermidine/putrescine transport system permease protein